MINYNCRKCGRELVGRDSRDVGYCLSCYRMMMADSDDKDPEENFYDGAIKGFQILQEQNESLKQSLRELIPLANKYTDLLLAFEPWREEGTKPTVEEIKEYVAAIDRAKSKLT